MALNDRLDMTGLVQYGLVGLEDRKIPLLAIDMCHKGGSLGGGCTLESADVPLVFDLNPPYQDFFRPPTTGLTELGDDMLRVVVRPDEVVEVYRVGPPATAAPTDG